MSEHIDLDDDLEAMVLRAAHAERVVSTDVVQSLWSGYGQIVRCELDGGPSASVIVKQIRWPDQRHHPRGWVTDQSHDRKLRSYRVEATWYERYARLCTDACRVPELLAVESRTDGAAIVLEDLDAAGFGERRHDLSDAELDACLSWLANFHATFMDVEPEGLWATGTYWHLETRPDELAALENGPLKTAAAAIDRQLAESPFQTLVHGDAKVANFCFAVDEAVVAAVDFQYVGGGCGMKDVAYFIGGCLDEDESERLGPGLLNRYFELLTDALSVGGRALDLDALEENWRALYPVAWTDFHRFLQGWSPGHWKLNSYGERLAREVLEAL